MIKRFLLLCVCLIISATAHSQCSDVPSCESLGFTKTLGACSGQDFLTCPFDNTKVFCFTDAESCSETCSGLDACPTNTLCSECSLTCTSGKKYTKTGCTTGWGGSDCSTKVCDTSVYKYACTGTGYAGGSGSVDPCGTNNKYQSCVCSSGYTWQSATGICYLDCSAYRYSCKGTGYIGGSGAVSPCLGDASEGKYKSCSCLAGYKWSVDDGICFNTAIWCTNNGYINKDCTGCYGFIGIYFHNKNFCRCESF